LPRPGSWKEPSFTDNEISRILEYAYAGRYTHPDRDWRDPGFHEDHIFPKSEFQVGALKKRGYDESKQRNYLSKCNVLCNLELLTESENLSKNGTPFDQWLQTRDTDFRKLATVGRMAAALAHEINNPLGAVTNLLFLIKGINDLPESARQYLDMADAELRRIAHLTRQSLGFYREWLSV